MGLGQVIAERSRGKKTTPAKFTDRQIKFVEEYIRNGGNKTAAARVAGYRGEPANLCNQADRILRKPNVQALIDGKREQVQTAVNIPIQRKRILLWEIAQKCGAPKETVQRFEKEVGGVHTEVEVRTIEVFDPKAAISAIAELNRMDGHHAAEKVEHKHSIEATMKLLRERRGEV